MRRPQARHAFVLAVLGVAAAFAACTLNPQPLPPGDDRNSATNATDGGKRADAGGFGSDPETPAPQSDAGANLDNEAGAGDAGDAGVDAGDASTDAGGD